MYGPRFKHVGTPEEQWKNFLEQQIVEYRSTTIRERISGGDDLKLQISFRSICVNAGCTFLTGLPQGN
jgi:hypothetical protein